MQLYRITKKTITKYYMHTIQVKISMDCLLMYKHILLDITNLKMKQQDKPHSK